MSGADWKLMHKLFSVSFNLADEDMGRCLVVLCSSTTRCNLSWMLFLKHCIRVPVCAQINRLLQYMNNRFHNVWLPLLVYTCMAAGVYILLFSRWLIHRNYQLKNKLCVYSIFLQLYAKVTFDDVGFCRTDEI